MIFLFQGRKIDVNLREISIDRKGEGWRCYEHGRNLASKYDLEVHVKGDHWVQMSERWNGGVPA